MKPPRLDDTIVAVSSDWSAAPIGVVRLSGPSAFAIAERIGAGAHPATLPAVTRAKLRVWSDNGAPSEIYWFAQPRSYTRQDVVEFHTIGALPWLRALADRLIELGARRATAGEFTGRAFLNGRIDAGQVDAIYALIHADSADAVRQAVVLARGARNDEFSAVREELTDLLALVEAGIDFVEEEDVVFIPPERMLTEARGAIARIDKLSDTSRALRVRRPTVALVGAPNAGKSTLFNALLGRERAIVSPVIGTTRDVLSADLRIESVDCTLQDCAGLGPSEAEIDLAARRAAEDAADQADLVVWVHASDADWSADERAALGHIDASRLLRVISKSDQFSATRSSASSSNSQEIHVSAHSDVGMAELRRAIAERVYELGARANVIEEDVEWCVARDALRRVAAMSASEVSAAPELVALELRAAIGSLSASTRDTIVEDVLGRIYGRFCIGK